MRREKSRVFDCVTFDCRERFCAVRNACGIAEIDESFVWQTLVQGAIDCQSANAAVEDSDGKVTVPVSAGLCEDLGDFYAKAGNRIVDEFVGIVKERFRTIGAIHFYGSLFRIYVPDRAGTKL